MAKFLDYAGLKEFLWKIIGAPTMDSLEYNLGVKDGKLVRVALAPTYTETYKFLSVSLAYDDIGNLGGTSSPTLKYTIIKETVYSDGTTTTEVVSENTGASVSYSVSGSASINSSTGVVTYNSANESTSRSTVGTVTATLKYEDASYTVTATVYQVAGTYSDSYSFSGVTLTYGDISNTGGSVSPTLSYTITRTRTYSWGATETSTVYTNTGASVSYSISGSASINSSTGQVTYSSASNTTSRASVGTVTATLKYEDASYTITATVYQAAETYTDTYSWLSLTLTYPTANRISNTVSPNVTGNTQRNRAYSNGSYTLTNYSASSASKTFSISNAVSGVSINTSNGVVSFGNNPNDTTRTLGNVTVNAYQNGLYKTASCSITQEARTNNTTYSWVSLSLSYPNANRLSGTVSPNVTSNIQKTISYSDGTSNITYMSMGSGSSSSYSISNAASDVSINTSNGVVTFGNNPNTTSRTLGTVTLNASQNSVYKTATANVTQNAGEIQYTSYTPVVNLNYSNAASSATTLSPTYNYNQRVMTTYPNGTTSNSYYNSGGTVTFSINSTTNATINSTTGVLNFANNPLTSSRTLGNVTLNVTRNGYTGTNSKVVYQNANTAASTEYYYLNIVYNTILSCNLGILIGLQSGSSAVNNTFNLNGESHYTGTSYSNYYVSNLSMLHVYNITIPKNVGNNFTLYINARDNYAYINYVNVIGGNIPKINIAYWLNGCNRTTMTQFGTLSSMGFTRVVTNAYYAFYGCTNLTTATRAFYNCTNLTNAAYAFYGCTNLTTAAYAFNDCTNLTNAAYAFYNCTNLTTAAQAFYGCTNLTTATRAFYNCTNLTNAAYAFYGCTNLTTAASAFYNCTNLTNAAQAFNNCRKLTTFDMIASSSSNVINFESSLLTNIANIFRNCINITGNVGFANSNNITCAANFAYRSSAAGSINVYVYNTTSNTYNSIYKALGNSTTNSTWNTNLLTS